MLKELTIPNTLFDLTPEQEEMSKVIYGGKVIKCLVAPYHTGEKISEVLAFRKQTYLFPESDMSAAQVRNFISMAVNQETDEEICIVTASQSIILDMIDGCVRILTERNEIVDCPVKTFMANIHDIRYMVLENKHHKLSDEERSAANSVIQGLIDAVQEGSVMTKAEFDTLLTKIDLVGEKFIAVKLKEMAHDNVKLSDYNETDAEIERIEKEIARLKALKGEH